MAEEERDLGALLRKADEQRLRVLIVEDSADDAKLIERVLSKQGFEVTSRRVDTQEAMKAALDGGEWDLVLADHTMPEFDSLTALKTLHQSGLDLPFIVVSGLIGEEVAVEAMKAGAHDYIMKGNLARLVPAIERELREATVRRERKQADEALRGAYAELETRVEQRTAELARVNEQLVRSALAAKEAAQREQALRDESEARKEALETVVESIGDAVFVCDATGNITLINSAALALLGKERGETLGTFADRVKALRLRFLDGRLVHEDDLAISRALRLGEVATGQERIVTDPKTQQRRFLLISAAPLHDKQERVVGAVEVATDVTRLRELQERQEEFVSLISHDLRSPLTSIMGMAQAAQRMSAKKGLEREAHIMGSMVNGAKRMDRMIQDLVESSRLETGQLVVRKEPVDVVRMVTDLAERVGTPQDRQRIGVETPEWVPPVPADAAQIERALTNILTNALKYSSAEKPVRVHVGRREDQATISVADQGVGIPPEDLPHIFERHFRAKTSSKQEGLGLGLYIASLIVEAHGGQVCAESEVGKGSTFYISLPLA